MAVVVMMMLRGGGGDGDEDAFCIQGKTPGC